MYNLTTALNVFHIIEVKSCVSCLSFKLMAETETGTLTETGITGYSRAGLREIAHHALTANSSDALVIG